ncbi:DUF11 domain-containing protein [uncultured Methanobacterium sp.]|uniref:DUF11 domain-containing protein n=1 Tax=uncultured Methanobacterium sp. TaxID=176306 RepID=UPI002AA7BB3C|nr:DUF11 domain-containing protein [uncultured Methanobacterium sp.]
MQKNMRKGIVFILMTVALAIAFSGFVTAAEPANNDTSSLDTQSNMADNPPPAESDTQIDDQTTTNQQSTNTTNSSSSIPDPDVGVSINAYNSTFNPANYLGGEDYNPITTAHDGDTVWLAIYVYNNGPEPTSGVNVANIYNVLNSTDFTLNNWQTWYFDGTWHISTSVWNPDSGIWTTETLYPQETLNEITTQYLFINATIHGTDNLVNNTVTKLTPLPKDEGGSDPNQLNDQASALIQLIPDAQTSVWKWYSDVTGDHPDFPGYTTLRYLDTAYLYLEANNYGPDNATGVIVTDVIPDALAVDLSNIKVSYNNPFTWVDPSDTVTFDSSTNTITWRIGDLNLGDEFYLQIPIQVVKSNTTFTNTVTLNQITPTSKPNLQTDSKTLTVPPLDAQTQVWKWYSDVTGVNPSYPGYTTLNYLDTAYLYLQAYNHGPDVASNVVLTDVIPTSLGVDVPNIKISNGWPFNWVSPAGSVTLTGNTLTWSIGTLNSNGNYYLQIPVHVLKSNVTINNTVTETQSTPTSEPSLQTASSSINIPPAADVSIAKQFTDASGNPITNTWYGANITGVITVTNHGPDGASNVVMTDTMPDNLVVSTSSVLTSYNNGATWISSDPNVSWVLNQLTWNIGNMTSGANYLLKFNGTVPVHQGTINNTANVSTSTYYPTHHNSSTASVDVVMAADLGIIKTVNDITPAIGQIVTYTLVATNHGPENASDVWVYDLLPKGVTFLNAVASQGEYFVTGANAGWWHVGVLNNTLSAVLNINCTVNPALGSMVTNTAEVSSERFDQNMANNIGSATFLEPVAALDLTVAASNPMPKVGEQFYYTVTVTNDGPNNATNVIISAPIPAGLTLNNWWASTGTYANGLWNIGTIPKGTSAVLKLYVTPTAAVAGNRVPFTATITSLDQYDPIIPYSASVNVQIPKENAEVSAKTVPMQATGTPLVPLALSALSILTGLAVSRRR